MSVRSPDREMVPDTYAGRRVGNGYPRDILPAELVELLDWEFPPPER